MGSIFLIHALQDLPITVHGDGKQLRDLLYIDDFIEALSYAEDTCRKSLAKRSI
jgi:dTDP-D-glucose 4,6-dehydratase